MTRREARQNDGGRDRCILHAPHHMQKTAQLNLALTAAACAVSLVLPPAAQAEPTAFNGLSSNSTLKVGGCIDMGFMGQHADGLDHTFQMVSNQEDTSRVFIRGKEDLGNGSYLRFLLQSSFNADTGTFYNDGLIFGQTMLVYGGSFGELAFGRIGALKSPNGDYSQFYEFGGISPMHTNFPYEGVGYTFLTNGNLNNSIVYQTPEFGPFRFTMQYSNGTMGETGEFSSDNHLLTLALRYKFGNWRGGTMLTWQTHEENATNQKAAVDNTYDLFTAINYRFPNWSMKFAAQYVYDGFGPGPFLNWSHFGFRPTNGRGFDTLALMFGPEIYVTGNDTVGLVIQGNRTEYKGDGPNRNGDLSGYRINPAFIWRHKLSKRMTLWTAASWSHGWGVYDRIDNSDAQRSTKLDRVNVTTYGVGATYFF